MTSPYLSPTTPPFQGRKIAPLPLRARSRSNDSPRRSQSILGADGTVSPSSSPGVNQSVSPASSISHLPSSYQSPDTTFSGRHLSPPAPDAPRIAFQFGQQGNSSLPLDRQETYTLRLLHNVTPKPSPEPEEILLPAFQDSPGGLKYSSLPEVATQDHEIPQPVHTSYSDEKIAVLGGSNTLEQGIPTIVEDDLGTLAATYYPSSTIH